MMNRLCAFLYFGVLTISCDAARLRTLPPEIAEQATTAAINYAWAASNERMGPKGDVAQNQLDAADAIDFMKMKSKGLMSAATVDDFKWMAFHAGWSAANERNGVTTGNQALIDQAKTDKADFMNHSDNLQNSGLFDETLVFNLKWMAWNGAWYAANTRDGNEPDDAKTDETYFRHYSNIIKGEVRLVSIQFDDNAGKVYAQKPVVVADQVLDNSQSGTEQSMTFQYTKTEGRTESWSASWGFKVGVEEKINAGFIFAGEETSFSFESSIEDSFSGSTEEGTQKQYSFPLVVPAHKVYQARATVHEATMDMPYTIQMNMGDYPWSSSGIWHGVAVSRSTYKIIDITPNSTVHEVFMTNMSNSVFVLI